MGEGRRWYGELGTNWFFGHREGMADNRRDHLTTPFLPDLFPIRRHVDDRVLGIQHPLCCRGNNGSNLPDDGIDVIVKERRRATHDFARILRVTTPFRRRGF